MTGQPEREPIVFKYVDEWLTVQQTQKSFSTINGTSPSRPAASLMTSARSSGGKLEKGVIVQPWSGGLLAPLRCLR